MLRRTPLRRGNSTLKRTPLKKFSNKKINKKEDSEWSKDIEFYMTIWNKRKHICRNCNKYLGSEPLTIYFHHILEKRNYKEYRHCEWNIIVLCWSCHQNADQNKIELVNRYRKFLLYKIRKGA
jgi:5-methylcytosine-specific restriction endonuclease McrA